MNGAAAVQRPHRRFAFAHVADLQRPIEIARACNSPFALVLRTHREGQSGEHCQAKQSPGRAESEQQVQRQEDRCRNAERKLDESGEQVRSDQPHEHASQRAAGGHHQVEEGQSVFRRGLAARQFAVAEHAANEQRQAEYRDLQSQPAGRACQGHPQTDGDPRDRHQPAIQLRPVPAIGLKAQNKTEQINRHRNDPEEWHGRHLLPQIIRDGQPQRGSAGGERDPEPWAGHRHDGLRPVRRQFLEQIEGCGGAQQHQQRQVSRGPAGHLQPRGEKRLDRRRVGQQCQQRRGVGKREEPVSHDCSSGLVADSAKYGSPTEDASR